MNFWNYIKSLFRKQDKIKKPYTIVSLFSGCGGLDLGFKQAGFKILYANEINPICVETYKKNIDSNIECKDIFDVDIKKIPKKPTVLIAGFPCQPFSNQNRNKNNVNDERVFYFKKIIEILKIVQPYYIVFENVPALKNFMKSSIYNEIIQNCNQIGYNVNAKILKFWDYGIAEKRQRLIFIGNRLNLENIFPSRQIEKKVTVFDVIGFLSEIPCSETPIKVNDQIIYNHIASNYNGNQVIKRKYSIDRVALSKYLREAKDKSGLDFNDLREYFSEHKFRVQHWFAKTKNTIPNPEEWKILKEVLHLDNTFDEQLLTMDCHISTYRLTTRKIDWNDLCPTLVTTLPPIHVNEQRRLSVRECALIHSFPINFIFCGSLLEMYSQIGNSVPPKVAYQIAITLKNYFELLN